MSPPPQVLTLLGATGYTGRLCAHEAVRRGLAVRLAGRDQAQLADLARTLEGADRADVTVARVDVDDADALARLVGDSTLVLTTVGPYLELGGPVLDACIAAGTDYLDVTGEVPFAARAAERNDAARATGAVVCPAVGYDGVPGELLAHVAAAGGSGPVESVRVAYRVRRGGATVGTLRSALGVAAHGGAAVRHGRLCDEPIGADTWRAPFLLTTMTAMSVPLPELVHLPRSLAARSVRTYLAVPGAAAGGAAARALGGALRTPVRSALRAVIDRLPEGPGDDARAAASTEVVVEVTRPSGRVRASAEVADVYGVTARIAIACALRLADPATRPAPGVTTPALVLGDAGAALDDIARSWTVSPTG